MINVAIIGTNFGAKVHVPAFKLIPDVNIISLYSHNWIEAMEDDNIHAVSIATPPLASYDILKSAIKYNKHIFCEKPFCANLSQATEIKKLLSKNIIHAIDFEICESEVVKYLKHLIDTRIFGDIKKFDFSWKLVSNTTNHPWKFDINNGGGAINNFGSHIFYLLEWIFSDRIINLSGKLLPSITINTCMDAQLNFKSFGGNLLIDSNTDTPSNFIFKVYCERGTFVLKNNSNILKNFFLYTEINNKEQLIKFEADTSHKDGRIELVSSIAKKFITGIKLNSQVTPNIDDGLRSQFLSDILLNESVRNE